MKKQKLNLEQLSVISFISSIPKDGIETVKGGHDTVPIVPTPPAPRPQDDTGSIVPTPPAPIASYYDGYC